MDWVLPVAEVNRISVKAHEGLLVGASDSYSVGDLLMPHVLTRLLNFSRLRCAGMTRVDFTSVGGHSVRNYGESALEMGGKDLQLVHFGGETLSRKLTSGYAAVATGEESERFESLAAIGSEEEILRYVRRRTGQLDDLAYVLAAEGEFYGARSSFHAVGLSEPERLDESARQRLVSILKGADFVGIRDEVGASFLENCGVTVQRMPCGLSVIPQTCARQLREHRDGDAMEEIRHRFPNGWVAVEIGDVERGDFDRLAQALREVADREGLGLVFFEARKQEPGAPSPKLRRWVDAFPEWEAAAFGSDNIWEIASLLLHSRLYCGTCLSCRVIAMSGGVARVNLPTGDPSVRSYCELWENDSVPIELPREEAWEEALTRALEVDFSTLQDHATKLHGQYFDSFEKFCRATGLSPRLAASRPETTPHVRASAAGHHLNDEWLDDSENRRLFRKLNRGSKKRFDPGSAAKSIRKRFGARPSV
ncbi:MAG: hypothetical protein WD342_11885 [Verrucomicrobiales bacterium]